MKKDWLTRLDAIELKSRSLREEELFDEWLSINYPDQPLDLINYLGISLEVPLEFKAVRLDRVLKQLALMRKAQVEGLKGSPAGDLRS